VDSRRGCADDRDKGHLVATKRLLLPLTWLTAFWGCLKGPVARTYSVDTPRSELLLVADASPWGIGAFLLHVPSGRALAWFASELSSDDVMQLNVTKGDSASQATLEALAVLAALRRWGELVRARAFTLHIRSDSATALALTERLASHTPELNFIAAELAIELERLDAAELIVSHIPGVWNDTADALSRRFAPSAVTSAWPPSALRDAKEHRVPVRSAAFYRLPSPGAQPSLWGTGAPATTGAELWATVPHGDARRRA
jgi:hypothetical protein